MRRRGAQTVIHNEAEALAEVREAVEKIVLPTGQPIELVQRSEDVVTKQAALAEATFGLATEKLRRGNQFRLRILPVETAVAGSSSVPL